MQAKDGGRKRTKTKDVATYTAKEGGRKKLADGAVAEWRSRMARESCEALRISADRFDIVPLVPFAIGTIRWPVRGREPLRW